MLRKEKAQRGLGGGRITTAANLVSTPNYSTNQVIFKPYVSGPLDLALSKIEYHRELARFHAEQADKHQRIKAVLEAVAFGGYND